MTWKIEFSDKARKQLDKLDFSAQERIVKFLVKRVALHQNPAQLGASLVGEFAGHISFRVGDYRVIVRLENDVMTILVIGIGHRKNVYN